MIVADANLVAYFIIDGKDTSRAEAVRVREKVWKAPALSATSGLTW